MIYNFYLLMRKWVRSNFSRYNRECNHQCAFGVRGAEKHKCVNRWHPMNCGKCWRANMLKQEE